MRRIFKASYVGFIPVNLHKVRENESIDQVYIDHATEVQIIQQLSSKLPFSVGAEPLKVRES
jgi:hypothetical protein